METSCLAVLRSKAFRLKWPSTKRGRGGGGGDRRRENVDKTLTKYYSNSLGQYYYDACLHVHAYLHMYGHIIRADTFQTRVYNNIIYNKESNVYT